MTGEILLEATDHVMIGQLVDPLLHNQNRARGTCQMLVCVNHDGMSHTSQTKNMYSLLTTLNVVLLHDRDLYTAQFPY